MPLYQFDWPSPQTSAPLAKDFWWGFHIYENFDIKPPIKADKNDLGVSASISWKF